MPEAHTIVRRAIVFALCAASALAQPAPAPLTLDDCRRLAEAAQSAVTIARQQAEIARYGAVAARANFLPQIGAGGLFGYNSPSLAPGNADPFSFVALNGVHEYSSLGNIGMEIDTSGRLRAQLARAKADQDAAAANVVLSRRDLRRAVAASFYRLALARKLVQVAKDNMAEAQAFEHRTSLLADNQEVAAADLIKASAQTAFFEQAVNAAMLEARLANHDLASFWTENVEAELAIADPLEYRMPLPESSPSSAAPYLRRPEFRLFGAQQRGFQADARRARAQLFPQLSLLQQWGVDATHFSFANRGYASFVHLDIPLFDWFRARSAARQSELQAAQVDTNRHIAERTFSKEYRDALARVDLVYAQIPIAEKQVKLSDDNLRLARIRYEGGEGSALDVVAAQTQLAQARANHFAAKANYLNAQADLEVAEAR